MLIGTLPPVDTKDLQYHYIDNQLAVDLILKCNAQSFKWINGYGLGYFLLVDNQSLTGATTTLRIDASLETASKTINLHVLDLYKLDHPDHTGRFLYVVKTAEEKYALTKTKVSRDYNVIDVITGTTWTTKDPDSTPKPLSEVVADFTSKTVNYLATTDFVGHDIFIKGMNALEALDNLCTAYGLLWSVVNDVVQIIDNLIEAEPDFDKINDIRQTMNDNGINNAIISFPVKDECIPSDERIHVESWTGSSSQARTYTTYHPYYPAIYDEDGEITNSADIVALVNTLRINYNAVCKIEGFYLVRDYYYVFDLTDIPYYYKLTYGDFGNGPRTVHSANRYPRIDLPEPAPKLKPSVTTVQGTITSISTMPAGPFQGKIAAMITVEVAPCEFYCLIGTSVQIIDFSECVLDIEPELLVGLWAWATWSIAEDIRAEYDQPTPCFWAADDRCCE